MPTLNRGRYVVRAVESCVAVDPAGARIEVIVLDSQSDDGSFEMLTERFRGDPRVTLVQNQRGTGPTRGWLDGARLAKGDFVTFIWSDDYISPDFLSTLLPEVCGGREVAYGIGLVRDIDDETPLPRSEKTTRLEPHAVLTAYFDQTLQGNHPISVSPCCSLFSRRAFDAWMADVEAWSRATPLREEVVWRRAIGPDLLLFLEAILVSDGAISCSHAATAQCSSHGGSITVSSHRFPYMAGYWMARLWALARIDEAALFATLAARSLAFGLFLRGQARAAASAGFPAADAEVAAELSDLLKLCRSRRMLTSVLLRTPFEVFGFYAGRWIGRLRRSMAGRSRPSQGSAELVSS